MRGDGVLTSPTVVIISLYTHVSKHPVVHLTHTQFLFVSYTSVRLEKDRKWEEPRPSVDSEGLRLIREQHG